MRCEPPICYAVLFFLPVSIKHLMKMGVGLVPTPCLYFPMSNSFFYLRKHEDMLYWGGSVWHTRNLSDPRPFTARKYFRYKYFRQYHMEYSSIWVPQGVLEYLGEYLEYLSTWVLSLSLGTKLKL